MFYTVRDLENLRDEFLLKEADTIGMKAEEYAYNDKDRLINFRQVAELENRSMKEVVLTLLLNHIQRIVVNVLDEKIDWSWKKENGSEGFKERLLDARIYLLLLAAAIDEEERGGEVQTSLFDCSALIEHLDSIYNKIGGNYDDFREI